MGCNSCKDKSSSINQTINNMDDKGIESDNQSLNAANDWVFRIFTFIMAMVILPFTFPIIVWSLFKHMVLKGEINLMPLFISLGKKLKLGAKNRVNENLEEEHYADPNDVDPDDYELVGVDEITKD